MVDPPDDYGGLRGRRRVLRAAVAGAVGLGAWHAPGIQVRDLRGAVALAAGSGPLVAQVIATSTTQQFQGNDYQDWGTQFIPVPFPTGNVEVRVRQRATSRRTNSDDANGDWRLFANTVPTGCTSCEVTSIVLQCNGQGAPDVSGVPGTGTGNLHCNSAFAPVSATVTATITVTCT